LVNQIIEFTVVNNLKMLK